MTQQDINVDEAQIGRVLHFVLEKGNAVQCRPALVLEDWPTQGKPGYVNLVVFLDGSNDGKKGIDNHSHQLPPGSQPERSGPANLPLMTRWETSVNPNHAVRATRTWHWPRECKFLHPPETPYVNSANEMFHHNHGEGVVDVYNCLACAMKERSQQAPANA